MDKSLEVVRQECDDACRERVLFLLGRDPVAEEAQFQEIVERYAHKPSSAANQG